MTWFISGHIHVYIYNYTTIYIIIYIYEHSDDLEMVYGWDVNGMLEILSHRNGDI
jgi:hypothetical protein